MSGSGLGTHSDFPTTLVGGGLGHNSHHLLMAPAVLRDMPKECVLGDSRGVKRRGSGRLAFGLGSERGNESSDIT